MGWPYHDQYFSDGLIQTEIQLRNGAVIPDDGTVNTLIYNQLVQGSVAVGVFILPTR